MTKEKVIEALELMIEWGDPYEVDCKACREAIRYLNNSDWKQGRKALIDDVKAEFINRYPKNWAGEPELGGASCEFSLCKVLEILDNISKEDMRGGKE